MKTSTGRIRPVLDYILDQCEGDERPYLKISVLGRTLLGLLDSGASVTILGKQGWNQLKDLKLPVLEEPTDIRVANGETCRSIGSCEVPFALRDRVKLIKVLVVPDLPHTLILGANFWREMGIVPDLRHHEWYFSKEPHLLEMTDHLRDETVLTPKQEGLLKELVDRNIALMGNELGCTSLVQHVIKTNATPIKQRYYPVSPVIQRQINIELDEMLRQDIVEPSTSAWSSPILLVKKKDGGYRFCVDYRKLNAVTERDSYPLPYISHTLDKLREAHYLSTLDIKSAFWQVSVEENSRQYTAFTVPGRGLFQFKRMPFGLHNSPATWQRLIDSVLGPELEPFVFVYLDDVVIVTQSFDKHVEVLEEVFKRLREANLTVSFEKCQFCRPSMRYLGYVVDRQGLHVDAQKVEAMLKLPVPRTVKEVRRVLGTFSWYRRFVPDFATIVSPLTALLKKSRKFDWTPACDEAFRKIKTCLISAPVLCCPDYELPFIVETDASAYGIGAVLLQPHSDGDRVISYLSRSLTKQERNFSTTERECLAVLWAVEKLRPYLEGVPFQVVTDHHSLVWLQNLKDPTGRLARWSLKLSNFDCKIIHRKGKDLVVPDMLSRSVPVIDEIIINSEISDKWYKGMCRKVQMKPAKFSNWRLQNGRLFKYVKSPYVSLHDSRELWKEAVPKESRKKIIAKFHEPPTSGHMGVTKTYARIAERFFWPKMKYDVAHFIRNCTVCATHKPDQRGPLGQMVQQPRVFRPWEMISTDLMGPLPRSMKGHQYICVITDYFSKYSLLFPLRTSNTETVCRVIEEGVFLVYGVPRIIICDNGPQYRSRQFQSLAERYGSKIRYNSNYHPQANPTERVNRTIKTMLASYVTDKHRMWDVNLAKIGCALRTAKHDSTGETPYFVNFGRRMVLSGTELDGVPEDVVETGNTERQEDLKKLFIDVRKRLDIAARKSEKTYNLRRRPDEFFPRQAVWRRNFVLSDASKYFTKKLAPRYIGPFFVKKKFSPWTYELEDKDGKPAGVWNAKDLKLTASAEENSPR